MSTQKNPPANDPANVTERLGKTIRRLRNAYNYSLGDLSEQSGVAKSIISQIEKNETNPTLSTLYKIAKALNAPIEHILRGEENPALVEKVGPSGTPLLISDDGLCRLRIVGWLKTVEIADDGTISNAQIDTLEWDTANGYFPQIIPVSGDVYAIAYRGTDVDGFLKTVQITSDGQIGNAVIDSL